MTEQKDNRTATQRIADLEKVVVQIYQSVDSISTALNGMGAQLQGMSSLPEAVKHLNRVVQAMVNLSTADTKITAPSVNDEIRKLNVEEMKEGVEQFVKNGSLVPTNAVAADSFVVGRETNSEGKELYIRRQLAVGSMPPEYQQKIIGAKVGDLVDTEANVVLEVQEIYQIVQPQAPAPTPVDAPLVPEAQTPEANPTAPAVAETSPAPAETPNSDPAPAAAATEATPST
jgi:hypothetical protein